MRHSLFLIFSVCLLFLSCEKDEAPMPPYVQELAEIQTDAQGFAQTLTLDQGEVLKVGNRVGGLKADTLLRVRALYQKSSTSIWLSDYAPVLTPHLAHFKPEVIIHDPVNLIACWRGLHYINLRLGISSTAEGKHIFGFHETGLLRYKDGTQTLQAVLLHDSNKDPQYYTREAYLSLPLRPLEGRLQTGRDTLELSIHTFKGWEVRKIVF